MGEPVAFNGFLHVILGVRASWLPSSYDPTPTRQLQLDKDFYDTVTRLDTYTPSCLRACDR